MIDTGRISIPGINKSNYKYIASSIYKAI